MDHKSDEIASMELVAVRPTGERSSVHVTISRPIQTAGGDWSCSGGGAPLVQFPRIGVHGMDSFQALALAVAMARHQLEHFIANGGKLFFASDSSDTEASLDAIFGSCR